MPTPFEVEAVSPDNLPKTAALKYDTICQAIGHLYLDSLHTRQSMEANFQSVLEQLRAQNLDMAQEIQHLREQLEKRNAQGTQ